MSDFGEGIPIISTLNDRQNSTEKLSPEVKLVEYMTEETLANADILNDGYSEQLKEWKLIIKYTGSLTALADRYGINATDLDYGYALIDVDRGVLPELEKDVNVVYVDKPKRLYIGTII
jgi:hypothetical protein